MSIRPERPEDFEAIRHVVSAAFGHVAEADLVEAIRASRNYIPELSLVAAEGDLLVGHVMINWGVLRSARTDVSIPMLSPLSVTPASQRRGIGSALVEAVCAAAHERGLPLIVLEGDPGYYGRFGFKPAHEYGIELPLPDWAPLEAGQVMPLPAYDPGLVGAVVYPPYFEAATRQREG